MGGAAIVRPMETRDLVAALTAARLLPPDEHPWSEHQRWVVEAGRRLVALGLDCHAVVRITQLGGTLAEHEVNAVAVEVGRGLPPAEALERQAARRRAVTRLVAAVRHGAVSQANKRLMGISDQFHEYSSDLLHQPSELFLEKHGLGALLSDLRTRAEDTDGAEPARFLGRLLIGLGRYAEASRWLERSLAADGGRRDLALAHLAVARLFLGEAGTAHRTAHEAIAEAPDAMLVLVFAAVVRAFEAGRSESMLESSAAVGEALELLTRSRDVAEDPDAQARMEAILARGRISVLLPPDFGIHQQGVRDLQEVLALCAHRREELALPPGVCELFQIHASYFLGMALSAREPQAASQYLSDVLIIDPACPFAERAYRRIGELSTHRTHAADHAETPGEPTSEHDD